MFFINKIKHYLHNRNYRSKVEYLRSCGARIGERTRLNCSTDSFGTEPYLVTVGSDCLFANGIHIITHDGGVVVLNNLNLFDGKKMDKISPVNIGNNVYIGTGAMIMPGVTIGNNVIIGAYAIVTKDIPDNTLAVGMPAKCIKSIDEYYLSAKEKDLFTPTIGMSYEEKKAYLLKRYNMMEYLHLCTLEEVEL